MNWGSASNFFAMGGYGFYVWNSYGAVALLIGVEIGILLFRKRNLLAFLQRTEKLTRTYLRPKAVTIVAGLLIAGNSAILVFSLEMMALYPTLIPSFIFFELGFGILLGIGILKGYNFARIIYLWFVPLSIGVRLWTGGFEFVLVVPAIIYVLLLIGLTNESAKKYFRRADNSYSS